MSNKTNPQYESVPWADFLTSTPPGVIADIPDAVRTFGQSSWVISHPDLLLYCSNESCQGARFFKAKTDEFCSGINSVYDYFLVYACRNCGESEKTFAVRVLVTHYTKPAEIVKLGEFPPFGPPTPGRVISLIGPDKDLFLKGRRAENQGLGIGAFSYYRRVIENQKSRIIEEIGKVAKRLGATEPTLKSFDRAAKETQFSRAVDDVKDAIPQSLLINGHNRLTLLHDALSEGLHAQTDAECLEIATSIRVVMTDLAERITSSLKDEAELRNAVSRLLNRKDSGRRSTVAEIDTETQDDKLT